MVERMRCLDKLEDGDEALECGSTVALLDYEQTVRVPLDCGSISGRWEYHWTVEVQAYCRGNSRMWTSSFLTTGLGENRRS